MGGTPETLYARDGDVYLAYLAYQVLVSGVIPPVVLGSRPAFTDRGDHELKGVPGPWRVFAVSDS
jgi:class 3 adenylate cyclase